MIKQLQYTLVLLLFCVNSQAQQSRISFINRHNQYHPEYYQFEEKSSSIQPSIETGKNKNKSTVKHTWVSRKLFHEDLAYLRDSTKEFEVRANPIWNFEYGKQLQPSTASDQSYYNNGRGIMLDGHFLNRFFFQTGFLETQSVFPSYIQAYSLVNRSIPKYGRAKYDPKTGVFDYGYAWGLIAYKATDNITFWLGNSNIQIGDGYRSMFISDFAAPFSYFRTDLQFFKNKLHYSLIYGSLTNTQRYSETYSTEAALKRKSMTTQLLTYDASENFKVSLFRSVLWQQFLSSDNNQLNGLQLSYQKSGFGAYSQVALSSNKGGVAAQIGVKKQNILKGLYLQAELNFASDGYNYQPSDSTLHFTQFGQPLNHPIFSGFTEAVFIASYRRNRFLSELKYTFTESKSNYNSPGNVSLLTKPFSESNFGFGNSFSMIEPSVGYVVNPAINFTVRGGAVLRQLKSNSEQDVAYFYLKLSTNIFNTYRDF